MASMAPASASPSAEQTARMDIVVDRDALLGEMIFAERITGAKITLPILSNILLTARNNRLIIAATNLEQSVVSAIPARVRAEGSVAIPARRFLDYLRLLPKEDVSLSELPNSWLQICCGKSKTRMVGMAQTNFPKIPTRGSTPVIKIPASALNLLIRKTSFVVSTEESRHTIAAALLRLTSETMTMVATDGRRLALVERQETINEIESQKLDLLIPCPALKHLLTLLGLTQQEFVDFAHDANTLFFNFEGRRYTSLKPKGSFPNYQAVIPTDNRKVVIVSTAEVEDAVRRVAQFADERSHTVKLAIGKNLLSIFSKSDESGESEETIETPYNGDELAIGFNSIYLLNFFQAIEGKGEVRMALKESMSSAVLQPESDTIDYKFLYVLMPCRF